MASPSHTGQPTRSDPGSVLCDKCKKSVLEPSQNAENIPLRDRIRQIWSEWRLSSPLWPMGYLTGSPYSPFHVEQELPNRNWRNAFEDLLALESGGEMISDESREQERTVAAKISWERASHCIKILNKLNARDVPTWTLAQTALNAAKSSRHQNDPVIISWLEEKIKLAREMAQRRVALAESFRAREETRREWPASRHKDRGQWMVSLITSGALTGWSSTLEDSEHGDLIRLNNDLADPEEGISFTEFELHELFDDGKPLEQGLPGPPLYQVSSQSSAVPDDDQIIDENVSPHPPPDEPLIMSRIPKRPYFFGQNTTAERITLPNGKTATRVLMKNYLTNGDVEEKVIVQEPGRVLQEVEKARALIQDRVYGFDQPIEKFPSA